MDYVSLPISASSRINNQLPVLNMSLPLFLERGRARTTACLPSPALLLTSRFNLHLCLAMPIRSARGICFVAWGLPSPSPARLVEKEGWMMYTAAPIEGNADFGVAARVLEPIFLQGYLI